ncbi:MAG: hypothetical protein WCP55_15840 [Lentisphaerota bacterium]|jgi:hypothetical protein
MEAVEFEVDSKKGIIKIPPKYKSLYSKHLKLIALFPHRRSVASASRKYCFDDLVGKLEWTGDPVAEQRKLRNEWQ